MTTIPSIFFLETQQHSFRTQSTEELLIPLISNKKLQMGTQFCLPFSQSFYSCSTSQQHKINMASFKEPRTKLENSNSKIILYDDLVNGAIPLYVDKDIETAEEIDNYHLSHEQYKLYDPQRIKTILNSLRDAIIGRLERSINDLAAYKSFKANHPPTSHTKRGKIQWQNSLAQQLLLEDINNDKHERMKKMELYKSRSEFHEFFDFKMFCDKFTQETRTSKYLYQLEVKGKSYKAS